MDPTQTHGAFSWNELMTSDPEAALAFYSELFGWSVKRHSMPDGDYFEAQVGGTSVAGVMKLPDAAAAGGMPPTWGSYVTVTDVDATCEKVAALGGKVVMGPQDIPGVGRFAVIEDPQGAVLNLMTYVREEE